MPCVDGRCRKEVKEEASVDGDLETGIFGNETDRSFLFFFFLYLYLLLPQDGLIDA